MNPLTLLLIFGLLWAPCALFAQTDPATEIETPGIYEMISITEEPKPINMTEVRKRIGYPEAAIKAGLEGTCIARILIDESGNYMYHKLIRRIGVPLDDSIEAAIPMLRFTPARNGEKAVKYWFNVPFRFKLLAADGKEKEVVVNEEGIVEPKPLNMADVRRAIGYPETSKKLGMEGTVIARLLIDEYGKYVRHKMIRTVGVPLNEAVEQKLHLLEFTPATRNDTAIRFWVNIPFKFKMLPGYNRELYKTFEMLDSLKYPAKALQDHIDGQVEVLIKVGRRGQYKDHDFHKSDHPVLKGLIEEILPEIHMGSNPPGKYYFTFIFEIGDKPPPKGHIRFTYMAR